MTTEERRRRHKGEGQVFKDSRSEGRWIARVEYEDPITGRMKRVQGSAESEHKATRLLPDLRKKAEKAKAGQAPAQAAARGTFGEYADRWVTTTLAVSPRKKDSTKALYGSLVKHHIVPSRLGQTTMRKVTRPAATAFVAELRSKDVRRPGRDGVLPGTTARHLAASTIRQTFIVVSMIADEAVKDGVLASNPFKTIERPEEDRHTEAEVLTPEQVRKLLAAALGAGGPDDPDSRAHSLIAFTVGTGVRKGEALALRWEDVNLDAGTIHVRGTLSRRGGALVRDEPKTKKSRRHFEVSSDVVETLRAVKRRTARERLAAGPAWEDTGYVFVTEKGTPVDPRNAHRDINRLAGLAGLPKIGMHTLRHTAATLMLSHGVPISTVSMMLGHASITITVDTYGHLLPQAARQASDVLARALQG
ncbi:tyrosine-type recombinase/integrase [Nocardioides sp. SR21]|uniref:tyrosine-type recombinase/integrase n=1 Tax=Nocardioides sp. SR21 TaxID=2919501 RepID=UPI001FA9E4E3|nr:tyrosine-type recombinase/integrase [Nocardioides sp. SR21]